MPRRWPGVGLPPGGEQGAAALGRLPRIQQAEQGRVDGCLLGIVGEVGLQDVDGLVPLLGLELQAGQAPVEIELLGIRHDGSGEGSLGFVALAPGQMHLCEAHEGPQLRLVAGLDGLGELGRSIVVASEPREGVTQCRVHLRARRKLLGLRERFERALGLVRGERRPADGKVALAHPVAGLRRDLGSRLERRLEQGPKLRERVRVLALSLQGAPEPEPALGLLGILPDGFAKPGLRFRTLALGQERVRRGDGLAGRVARGQQGQGQEQCGQPVALPEAGARSAGVHGWGSNSFASAASSSSAAHAPHPRAGYQSATRAGNALVAGCAWNTCSTTVPGSRSRERSGGRRACPDPRYRPTEPA